MTLSEPIIVQTPTTPVVLDVSHEELLKALYWIWDAFDRAMMHMFVVGNTYHAIKEDRYLFGDRIDVGVRRLEWDSGARRIFEAFTMPPDEETSSFSLYIYNKIPVYVHIYDDDSSITTLNMKMYLGENFNFPTPYERFEKLLWK